MGELISLTNWNISYLKAVVEKFVYRNVISKEFLNALDRLPPDGKLEDPDDRKALLSLLFKKAETKFFLLSPEILLSNLFKSQHFPNNSQFYGFGLNFENQECVLWDTGTNKTFISKQDALSRFYTKSSDILGEKLGICARLTGKSVLNEIGRSLEGTFELIPFDLLEENILKNLKIVFAPREDGFGIHSLFNKEYDTSLIEECAKHLLQMNEKENLKVLQEMLNWRESVKKFFKNSPWFNEKHAILRQFQNLDNGAKYFQAKEVEDILGIVMMKKYSKPFPKGLIPVENEEDRGLGILRTVEVDTFHKVLRILKLEEKDMTIVPVNIYQSAPTNTPYGTYCKLARHTFLELFDQLSYGMDLWRKLDKKNIRKISEFFENLISEGVFSTQRNYRYCIEIWKFDEILKRAFDELGKLVEPDGRCYFEIRDVSEKFSRQKSLEIMRKMAPHAENQTELREDFEFYMRQFIKPGQKFLEAEDVYGIFQRSLFNSFIRTNLRVKQFMQCQGMIRNVTVRGKNMGLEKKCEEEEELPFGLYVEKFKEAFVKYLPKIPFTPTLEYEEMMTSVYARMGEYTRKSFKVQKSDRKAELEITKFIGEHVECHFVGDECFVSRRRVPIVRTEKSQRAHDIFSEDTILNSIITGVGKHEFDDGSCWKLIRERLEEKLGEDIDEIQHKTIIELLEKIKLY